jgi:hypothetical protein
MDDDELPFVVMTEVGNLPDNGIAIRITYAKSAERHAARQWDTAVFAMREGTAIQLGKALLERSAAGTPPAPKAPRH